jgi:hypothetical protein
VVTGDQPLTIARAEAFTNALDLGQLDNARALYDTDTKLTADKAKASVAHAAAALMIALGGDLTKAEARLKDAEAAKGDDARAIGYVDLASASIALARGELKTAAERSERCANALMTIEPLMASMCQHVRGDALAEVDEPDKARVAYEAGRMLAERSNNVERISNLSLAIAQLDFDEKQHEVSIDPIVKLQRDARRRLAVSCEANAAVLASRVYISKSDQQKALDLFDNIDPSKLQSYRTRIIAMIALGEVHGYRKEGDEDNVTGLDRIRDAKDDATKRDHWGLVLEARLAEVRVLLTTAEPNAEEERAALIKDANARGYKRIARLAEAHLAEKQ